MNWTEKEKLLFKDLKTSERTSIEKYGDFEGRACDPELKQLFGRIRQQEEEHLQTLEQMEGGVIPMMTGAANRAGRGRAINAEQPNLMITAPMPICAPMLWNRKNIFRLCMIRLYLNSRMLPPGTCSITSRKRSRGMANSFMTIWPHTRYTAEKGVSAEQ